MGFPGMLPSLNSEVVRLGVIAGMLMNCEINKVSRFDRKSYFYPDLPNSFQTTQMYEPIVGKGEVRAIVWWEVRTFPIHHMHLENDAGKLIHAWGRTLCDYNRAGSPLMEIVTEPNFHEKDEVMEFLKELQKMFRAFWVSDADMEKWQLRCDVNISVRKKWETILNNRVELKNLNSFSAIGRAIDTESQRQIRLVEKWQTIAQETRWWDDDKGTSTTQRSKEDAMDYRYFPEPDLLPVQLTDQFIADCRAQIWELPLDKRLRYLHDYGLSDDDVRILTVERETSDYFEKLLILSLDAKKTCSYITTVLMALMNESFEIKSFSELKFDISELAEVIKLVNADELSSTNSKLVIEQLFISGWKTQEVVERLWVRQKNDLWALESVVEEMIANFPQQIADYKWGNEKIFWFLVGQCMKISGGQGNPKIFNELLKKKLV
jgi:aspartyl-tRNA(Asn)/glutamyl-tRNA(Gln) amidotransferase subunit B